uniref:NADH-ubiquinone oxidoreductase chain 4 n=1 Tax=Chrysaora pacifica TaxID=1911418 RepID=A0A6G7GDV7_9CNID|nr:NADH dehydrogenase subunit 4 [Chrysaora pacifica]QIH96597.1 NADH dehydrogenase subunit 4 [Chrysaora pacifica]
MLIQLISILVISSLIIWMIPNHKIKTIKRVGLLSSFGALWLTILIWITHFPNPTFQLNNSDLWIDKSSALLKWGPLHFGLDEISIPFLLLTAILTPICILISWNSIKYLVKEFILCLLLIHLILIGVFTSLNILLFYILFEIILIPMFVVIGVWGSRKEKEKAAYYFFFYTLAGSLFMLLSIFAIYNHTGTLDYQSLLNITLPQNIQLWCFLGFFISLAVKIPMVPLHIWLPQAHVEAPVAGSVILAGVLLKLGGYGFIRFSWNLFPEASEYLSPIIMLLSAIAIIYASLSTCRQTDAKRLVAYSSVAHMGIVTLGIFSKTIEGIIAAMILMLAHGLVSSGLFIVVTNLYDRFHTKLIRYYKGITYTMPLFSTIFFVLILANIAFPISLNFIGEFISIFSALQYSQLMIIPPLVGMVLSAAYSLTFFNKIAFGFPSQHTVLSRDLNRRELFSPLLLSILTIILGLTPITIMTSFSLPYIL